MALAALALAFSVAPARAVPETPKSRLLNVWLDLRLLGIFYPKTTSRTFLPNLAKIARQLNQELPPIRFGDSPPDTRRFTGRAVVIKRHPPKDTWILYTRSGTAILQLMDDPQGNLTIKRVPG